MSTKHSKKRTITPELQVAIPKEISSLPRDNPESEISTSMERKCKRSRTEEEKRHNRIMANRRSAKESRERKRMLMAKLELCVLKLTKENAELRKCNEKLQHQVEVLMSRSEAKSEENVTTPFSIKELVQSLHLQPNYDQLVNNAFAQRLYQNMSLHKPQQTYPFTTQASTGSLNNKLIDALRLQNIRRFSGASASTSFAEY